MPDRCAAGEPHKKKRTPLAGPSQLFLSKNFDSLACSTVVAETSSASANVLATFQAAMTVHLQLPSLGLQKLPV